jgi:ribosomal protein S18 acetylase RimI-like enzyme
VPTRLRTATPADVEALLVFWRLAGENSDRLAADSAEAVRRLLDRDPDALILAEDGQRLDGDRIVGTVIAGWDGWRCHLYRFAVHPEYRRRGIGRALLAAAEHRATSLGGRRADAMVLARNNLAQHAWTASGYRPQPGWERWVKLLARHA